MPFLQPPKSDNSFNNLRHASTPKMCLPLFFFKQICMTGAAALATVPPPSIAPSPLGLPLFN